MTADMIQLTPEQLAALQEIGDIGIAHSARSLSEMIHQDVNISLPSIRIIDARRVPETVGGETLMIGVYLQLIGGAPSNVLMLFPRSAALLLVDLLMGKTTGETDYLTKIDQSALKEIGNIIGSAFADALANLLGVTLVPTPPSISYDMAGALVDYVLLEFGTVTRYAVLFQTRFEAESKELDGYFFLFPKPESLSVIFNSLGIEL